MPQETPTDISLFFDLYNDDVETEATLDDTEIEEDEIIPDPEEEEDDEEW